MLAQANPQFNRPSAWLLGVMAWDIESLRNHIERLGSDYAHLIETVNSISRSTDLYRFHLFAARDWSTELYDGEPDDFQASKHIFGVADNQREFRLARLSNQAHLIACTNMMRSRWDMFAQLVNGLLLSFEVDASRVSIKGVQLKLPAGSFKDQLDETLSSPDFLYFSDFSNLSKHRLLIQQGYFVSFTGEEPDIKISAFTYERGNTQRSHVHMSGKQFIEKLNHVADQLVYCGIKLNEELKIST